MYSSLRFASNSKFSPIFELVFALKASLQKGLACTTLPADRDTFGFSLLKPNLSAPGDIAKHRLDKGNLIGQRCANNAAR